MSNLKETHRTNRNSWSLFLIKNKDLLKLLIDNKLDRYRKISLLNELFYRVELGSIYFNPYHEF